MNKENQKNFRTHPYGMLWPCLPGWAGDFHGECAKVVHYIKRTTPESPDPSKGYLQSGSCAERHLPEGRPPESSFGSFLSTDAASESKAGLHALPNGEEEDRRSTKEQYQAAPIQ